LEIGPKARAARLASALVFVLASCSGSGSSPTEPAAPAIEVWGAVGCSQTRDVVDGYHLVGGTRAWPVAAVRSYSGGALFEWANLANRRWTSFQSALDEYGADAVWLEICIKGRSDPAPTAADRDAAETIVREIARRAPTAVVYASAMNDYDGVVCQLTGPAGPAVSRALADHLVAQGVARRGPVVGPLDASTVRADQCHANEAGKILQGEQLLDFFG
jgi:hypothetical protein